MNIDEQVAYWIGYNDAIKDSVVEIKEAVKEAMLSIVTYLPPEDQAEILRAIDGAGDE